MSNFPLPYSSIKRSRKRRPEVRIGKEGIVRLTGKAMDKLRLACWNRDQGSCQQCRTLLFYEPRFDGDPDAYDMAHRRNKRMYGDTLENVAANCHRCHMKSHTEGLRG